MRKILASFTFPIVALFAPAALATGLAIPPPEGERGPPVSLGALQSLAVDARLADGGVEVSEIRKYALARYAGTTISATFYSSLVGPGGTSPTVTVDGQPVTGSVLAAAAADAVRRRLTLDLRDPTSLRSLGTSLYVSDPIQVVVPAGGTVEVRVKSGVPLSRQGTMMGLVMPIDWARPTVPTVDVTVSASSEAPLRALYSPFHPLDVVRDGVSAAHATYAGKSVCTDLDLTLLFSSGKGLVHLDLLPFRSGEGELEGGTFLALVTPDPTPVTANVLPCDLALVLDTSGSMAGAKMTQAKDAVRGVLMGLRPADSFSLVSFATAVSTFQAAAMVKATEENIAAAIAFVDGLTATGSTNIDGALRAALGSLSQDTGHPRYVVFLTDGQPTAGETKIDAIAANVQAQNEVGARIFSFGIGTDVNTLLLDRLARDSAGDTIYIRPEQSVAAAVQTFFQQIADPVVADPRFDLAAFGVTDLFPETMPDFFAGRTITLLGRYATAGRSPVVLSGMRDGQPWSVTFDVTLPMYAIDSGYVPRIWALRQVGRLLGKIKEGNTDPSLVDQVLRVATRFGVTTAYTTFATDADGNVALRYTAVPVAQTGAAAVNASSSLRDYGMSGSVPVTGSPPTPAGAAAPMVVRYVADRTLPPRQGYLTDTKLPVDTTAFTDLAFGSDRYFAFASAEAAHGAPGLLATGANVRFELLGRAFRVTQADALPTGTTVPPPESSDLPAPMPPAPAPGGATVISPTTDGPAPVDGLPPPGGGPAGGDAHGASGLAGRQGCACATGANTDGGHAKAPPAVLFALAFVMAATRRRRR